MTLLAFNVRNFDGYFVTNTGSVYSRDYKHTGRIKKLKPIVDINGYLTIDLVKNGKRVNKKIHRLVAEVFIPNIENKPQVNHKNGAHDDNRVENLEWCTQSENNFHAYRFLHKKACFLGKKGSEHPNSKPVLQIKNNAIVAEFAGLAEADRQTGICQNNIRSCCRGRRRFAGGYQWMYK